MSGIALTAARVFAPVPIAVAAAVVIVLVIVYFRLRKYVFGKLTYSREFSDDGVFEGEETTLVETIVNPTPFPIFWVDVESFIYKELEFRAYIPDTDQNMQYVVSRFNLMPFTKVRRKHAIGCVRRGYYKLETATLWCGKLTVCLPSETDVYVYPKLTPLYELPRPLSVLQGNSVTSRRLIADPFSFSGIRDYRFGDSFSSINFKATAKAPITGYSSIKVNNCDFCANRSIIVYMNFQTDVTEGTIPTPVYNELMEDSLSCCAGIIGEAMTEGYRVGLAANCTDVAGGYSIRYPMESGNSHLTDMLRGLATVRPTVGGSILHLVEEDIRSCVTDTEFYFISTYVDGELSEKLAELERAGNVVTVIKLEGLLRRQKIGAERNGGRGFE